MNTVEATIAARTMEDVFYFDSAVTIAEVEANGDGIPSAFVTGDAVSAWVPIDTLSLGRNSIARDEAARTCPVTGRLDCKERGCELHYQDAPVDFGPAWEAGVAPGKSTNCAGSCCYNALKDACEEPSCDCHAKQYDTMPHPNHTGNL